MLYHIETEERTVGHHAGTVYTLVRNDIGAMAEIWPSLGFNCLKWQCGGQDLLYAAADWYENPLPTRSGIPILFPFPNRIRDGRFTHEGKSFQLPKNDSTHLNAIHGFSPRIAWRVSGYGADAAGAWLHGDFQLSVDAGEVDDRWPADGILSVVYRLGADRLRIEMRVRNAGPTTFPFGVGLHPYFRLPVADADIARYRLHAPARSVWPLVNSLPTGDRARMPDDLNWNRPRPILSTALDTVYGDLGAIRESTDGLLLRAALGHDDLSGQLEVWTSPDFRESVLFAPPHRKAVCIEPYTCTTDAINLGDRGIDGGWRVLPVGGEWAGIVELRWNESS